MADMTKEEIAELRKKFMDLQRQAEQAAYAYFSACPVGPERIWAAEVYENVRTATRVPMET